MKACSRGSLVNEGMFEGSLGNEGMFKGVAGE